MNLRRFLGCFLLSVSLGFGPALAQPSPPAEGVEVAQSTVRDYLSYYTYYKTAEGETVASLATRFGLAKSSLLQMNPYLAEYDEAIPTGTLVSVPQGEPRVNPSTLVARGERLEAKAQAEEQAKEKAEARGRAQLASRSKLAKSGKAAKTEAKPKVQTNDPDEAEWNTLAGLCTNGAPVPPPQATMNLDPPSRFIGSDGRVTFIPAAKPRAQLAAKVSKVDPGDGKLHSKKGKAIYAMVRTGRSFMGTPYVWGGEDPSGFDCSGYIQYVFAKHNINMPRTADIQYNVGKVVPLGQEKPGDLVFFETYCPGPSHVGIYLGRDRFMHASSSRGVTVDRLSSDFFAARYLGAKRNF